MPSSIPLLDVADTFWMPQLIKNTGITSAMTVGLPAAIPHAASGTAWW